MVPPVGELTAAPGDSATGGAEPVQLGELTPRVKRLRQLTAEWFAEMAAAVEKPLFESLRYGASRWDQVDALELSSRDSRERKAALVRAWTQLDREAEVTPARQAAHAAALEAITLLDTTQDLLTLLERRLATFVRLRLQSDDPRLLPGERPFLDVARALAQTAEAFR